jgi:hypothetical protein
MSIENEITNYLADNLQSIQLEREIEAYESTVERTMDQCGQALSTQGTRLFDGLWPELVAAASDLQLGLLMDQKQLSKSHLRLLMLTPEQLASVIHSAVMGLPSIEDNSFEQPLRTFQRRCGVMVGQHTRTLVLKHLRGGQKLSKISSVLSQYLDTLGLSTSERNRKVKKQAEVAAEVIEDIDAMTVGVLICDALLPVCDSFLMTFKRRTGTTEQHRVAIREEARDQMIDDFVEHKVESTPHGFMVCQPHELTETSYSARERYLTKIKSAKHEPFAPSEQTLRAANAIQSVGYTVNPVTREVLGRLSASQLDSIVGVQPLPKAPNEGESEWLFKLRERGVRFSNKAKRASIKELQIAAAEAQQYGDVFFPAYLDFRGRIYQVDYKGLGPQSTKTAKALLMMSSEGVELGPNGLWWAYHELANSMGWDKDSLTDKVAKAEALTPKFGLAAVDPMADLWWLEGDDPLKALAVAVDIHMALESGNPETYKSRLFGYADGSCNGMQHLSLLTRDVQGAVATNVVATDAGRQDLYMAVAEEFLKLLEDDESIEADFWKTYDVKAMRSVVKRAVMTTPYGVTGQGLADQVVADGFCATKAMSDPATKAQAQKFKETVAQALQGAAPKAMELRDWLVNVAEVLCKAGVAPTWITPVGSQVVRSYVTPRYKNVRVGKHMTRMPDYSGKGGKLDTKKNKLAIVANVIHSFDGAMLQDTVLRMLENEVTTLTFVHDSYGAGFGNMDLVASELRQSAVDIYSVNQLEALQAHFQSLTDVEIPAAPEMGSLAVSEVLNAPYFFA